MPAPLMMTIFSLDRTSTLNRLKSSTGSRMVWSDPLIFRALFLIRCFSLIGPWVEAVRFDESTSSSITIGRSIPRSARLHDTASGPPTSRTLLRACPLLPWLGGRDQIVTYLLSPFQTNVGMKCASIVVASHQVGFCRCHLRNDMKW
jgi:hypothetical protein